ncbi:hypothetical protein ARMGADRAFT_1087626 [Armillaria gallica]|uniref:Uncharacterized protein n=1 Tax=Armillaria gallica TaxID=47427 RepID=A0A2H3CQ25_ARMGA|nr:hypothetical protein ARMGADRAFT_1087626 [Armillaria gallica]
MCSADALVWIASYDLITIRLANNRKLRGPRLAVDYTKWHSTDSRVRVFSPHASINGFLWSVVPTLTVLENFKMGLL